MLVDSVLIAVVISASTYLVLTHVFRRRPGARHVPDNARRERAYKDALGGTTFDSHDFARRVIAGQKVISDMLRRDRLAYRSKTKAAADPSQPRLAPPKGNPVAAFPSRRAATR